MNEFNGTLAELQSVGFGSDGGVDAGVDAGSDAGVDGGPPPGADGGPDAGRPLDAGTDGGSDARTDAGPGFDAGPLDAGTPIGVPNPPDDKGCGCGAGGGDGRLLWMLGALVLFRRRR
jgi:MYXO-CTERM domain-containing protein